MKTLPPTGVSSISSSLLYLINRGFEINRSGVAIGKAKTDEDTEGYCYWVSSDKGKNSYQSFNDAFILFKSLVVDKEWEDL